MVHLDARLAAVAALIPSCARLADIGADHGRLAAYLAQTGRCERIFAIDVSAKALARAVALFERLELVNALPLVGDGFAALDAPCDVAVLAGMGAYTQRDILLAAGDKLGGATLVLQPNCDVGVLRAFLCDFGYAIECERVAFAGGRWYVMLRAVPGGMRLDFAEMVVGPCLLRQNSPECLGYARHELDTLEAALRGAQAARGERARALSREAECWREAIEKWRRCE